ncbi:MAG TPA: MFS transporter [Candidatus Dormibacteraeota bacterium]|nr:MFS transporter [Candidatus Dormibacteraeota bacterium]
MSGLLLLPSPLYVSVFLMRFSFGLVLFTLPIFLPRREFSNLAVGVIAAAYPVTETICGPLVGFLVDRLGRRKWIYLGLTISTIALLAFPFYTNIAYLAAVHAVQGIAAAMIIVSSLTMVTDASSSKNRGKEMGVYDFANLGGYMVGILAAGFLTRLGSRTTPFYFAATLAAVGAIFAYFKLKETRSYDKRSALSPIKTLKLLFSHRRAAAMFPIWLAITTFVGVALTFGPRLGPSPFLTSIVLAGSVLVLAVTQPLFGYLSDKYGRDKLMMLGLLSIIGLFYTAITMLRGRIGLWMGIPFLTVFGLGSFAFPPAALASLGDLAPERSRGVTMGAYSVVISFGTIVGPLMGGYLLDRYGPASLFYAGLVLLIGALGLAILIGSGGALPTIKPLTLRRIRS